MDYHLKNMLDVNISIRQEKGLQWLTCLITEIVTFLELE